MTRRLQSKNHREGGGEKEGRWTAIPGSAPWLKYASQMFASAHHRCCATPLVSVCAKVWDSLDKAQGIRIPRRCSDPMLFTVQSHKNRKKKSTHVTTTVESEAVPQKPYLHLAARHKSRAHAHQTVIYMCRRLKWAKQHYMHRLSLKTHPHFLSSLHCHWPDLQYRL